MSGIDRKAYVHIDFAFAAFIFLTFFLVVNFMVDSQSNAYQDTIISTKLEIDAAELCNYLKTNTGSPYDWDNDINASLRIGIKNLHNNSINISKFSVMNTTNYFAILDVLEMNDFLYIQVKGLSSDTQYLDFGVSAGPDSYRGTASCYSTYNGEEVQIITEVWR